MNEYQHISTHINKINKYKQLSSNINIYQQLLKCQQNIIK